MIGSISFPGRTLILLPVLLGLASMSAAGQTRLTENTLRLDEASQPAAASIDDVAWLAGHWRGEGLGASAEEVWLPPLGKRMSAVFRLSRDGSVEFYEIVTLAEEEGTLVLRLKHFGPDLVGWEEKEQVVDFRLVRIDPATAWFDGFTVRRIREDEMHIWVALDRGGESLQEAHFRYRRVGERP